MVVVVGHDDGELRDGRVLRAHVLRRRGTSARFSAISNPGRDSHGPHHDEVAQNSHACDQSACYSRPRRLPGMQRARKTSTSLAASSVNAVKKAVEVSKTIAWAELEEWQRDNEYILAGYRR